MINFNNDEDLGKVIDKKQLFSFGAAPITSFKEIVFAAGGHKFSSLCGFKFISKAETDYKEFFIAFVCKLRSKIYHNAINNPSQWYVFKKISNKEMHCLDAKSLKIQYGFDLTKFFDSDLFETSLVKFKKCIDKGLKTYVPEYVKAHGLEKAKDQLTSYDGKNDALIKDAITRYTTAIEESLEHIDSKSYNNKFYKLFDYDIVVDAENEKQLDEAISTNDILTVEEVINKVKPLQPDLVRGSIFILTEPISKKYYTITDVQSGRHLDPDGTRIVVELGIKELNDKLFKLYSGGLQTNESTEEKLNEDDIVQEASKFECIVKPEKDGSFGVYEKSDNFWVATFQNQIAAEEFALQYPQMKEKYLRAEAEEKMVEKEVENKKQPTETELDEQQLDKEIDEALKEIYC